MDAAIYEVCSYLKSLPEIMTVLASAGIKFNKCIVKCYDGCYPYMYKNLEYYYGKNTGCQFLEGSEKLVYADCRRTKIREVPYLPSLKYLDIRNTRVKKLLFLPSLTTLYCDVGKLSIDLHKFPRLVKINDLIIRR